MDLSRVQIGDHIWTIQSGWTAVTYAADLLHKHTYPILVDAGDSYTLDGKYHVNDAAPSAFIDPPQGFNAGPRPSRLTKDEPVLPYGVYPQHSSHEEKGV